MASNGKYSAPLAPVKIIHSNLDQEIIQVTEDKLRLVLNEHIEHIEQRQSWIAPLSILIAILTIFTTATFKDTLVFKAPTWEAIFFIVGVGSFLWLIFSLVKLYNAPSVQDIVEKIKNNHENQ